jgi:hypothetical protein
MDEHDELLQRVVGELQTLPAVPPDATARVLARVEAAHRDATTKVAGTSGGFRRRFVVSLPAALGYAVAATVAGFLIRGAVSQPGETPAAPVVAVAPASTLGTPLTTVAASRRALQEAPLTVQFVLDAKHAKRVAVVGDFNAWDGSATPLERDSTTGIWSALVDVRPGRHVYAFLVDGTTWTLDPNAPRTKDVDYGTEQSVMIAGLR